MRKTVIDGRFNTQARRFMRQAILDDPDLNMTALAELTADALGHDDWLDDERHWIWDVAVQVCEWASKLESDTESKSDDHLAASGDRRSRR